MKDAIIKKWALTEIWVEKLRVSRKAIVIICGVTILLLLTNPSPYSFKQYIPIAIDCPNSILEGEHRLVYGRTSNFVIFSVYRIKGPQNLYKKHIGVFNNFIEISI